MDLLNLPFNLQKPEGIVFFILHSKIAKYIKRDKTLVKIKWNKNLYRFYRKRSENPER